MTQHTITLKPDHATFSALESETLLNASIKQGLNLPHSCQNGSCGQCKAEVISGTVEQHGCAEHALSAAEAASGKILLCCSYPQSDLLLNIAGYNGAHMPPVKTLPVRVHHIHYQQHTAILTLTLPKRPPFAFLAGQYIDILLKDGQSRSYSIANSSKQPTSLELHIRQREQGLLSNMLFGEQPSIQEKSILRIRGPLGTFILNNPQQQPIILLATGTGFAPIQSMLHQLIDDAADYPIHLYWGARTAEDLYAQHTAADLIAQLPNGHFTPVLSRPHHDWQGAIGYVTHHALQNHPNLSNHQVYACGSNDMIRSAQQLCTEHGLLAENFFADAFLPTHT